MEILIGLITILFTWFFANHYYKKSLQRQSEESQKEIKELLSILENQHNNDRNILLAKILEEAIDEYKHAGTPVRVLDSHDDITIQEKADIYDKVMLRMKGRLGKSNKYRKE